MNVGIVGKPIKFYRLILAVRRSIGLLDIYLCVAHGQLACTCKSICTYISIYGQASGVPSPPPRVWSGGGGGAGMCGEGSGRVELQLEGRPGITDEAMIVCKPYASHKSCNVAQSRVLLFLF